MQLAANGGWRVPGVQTWMIRSAVAQGKTSAAILRIDALLRQNLLTDEMTSLLRQLASDTSATGPLIDRLTENPTWRQGFLTNLQALSPADAEGQERLLLGLRRTAAPPTASETSSYLSWLVAHGEPLRALRLWHILNGKAPSQDLIEDPTLGRVVSASDTPSPFGWIEADTPGLAITPDSNSGSPGLEISFDGTGPARALSQLLVLAPGSYRLSALWQPPEGGGRSLRLQLACVDGGDIPLENHRPWNEQGGTNTIVQVTIPAGCATQRLTLWLDSHRGDAGPLVVRQVAASR
jgi:hypothetical protein